MSWRDDLNYGLAAFGVQIPASLPIENLTAAVTSEQAKNAAIVTTAGAILFLHFEKPHNPAVHDIGDALLYASTCLNAGHSRIHPVTKAGKLLGSLLLTCGPSLTAHAASNTQAATQAEVLATLRNILRRLQDESEKPV